MACEVCPAGADGHHHGAIGTVNVFHSMAAGSEKYLSEPHTLWAGRYRLEHEGFAPELLIERHSYDFISS
jgi:hypothetical protein